MRKRENGKTTARFARSFRSHVPRFSCSRAWPLLSIAILTLFAFAPHVRGDGGASPATRPARPPLAVVSFEAAPDCDPRDTWTATAIEEMLAWRLRRVPALIVIPTVRSYQTRMDYRDDKAATPPEWPQIVRLLGGQRYLTGVCRGAPEAVVLELNLFETDHPQNPVEKIALPPGRLLDVLDQATRWALERLRVPPPDEKTNRLLSARPASPTALEYYAKAVLAARNNQVREAGNYAMESLEYDSGFRPALLLVAQLELRFIPAARQRAATRLRVLNEIARRQGDDFDRVEAELALGLLVHQTGAYEAALQRYYNTLLVAAESDDIYGQLAAIGSLCDLYLTRRLPPRNGMTPEMVRQFDRQNLERALEWQGAALEMLQDLGDVVAQVSATNKLALIYEQLGDADQALALHKSTLAAARQTGSPRDQASAWMFIGQMLQKQKRWAEALDALNQCLALAADSSRPAVHVALADLHRAASQPTEALQQYEKAYEGICGKPDSLPTQLACLRAIAELRMKLNQRAQAITALQEALDLAHALEIPAERDIREQLERWKRGGS